MAPKGKQTNLRGKKENNPKNLWNQEKFLTKEHEDHYHKIMGLRSVIPEVKFDLKEDEYPEIQEQIRNRGWEVLTNPEIKVGRNMVQEFYSNLWLTDKQRMTGTAYHTYRTMVRGKVMYFHLDKIREIFKLPQLQDDPESFNRRMVRADKGLDQVLEDICLPGTKWITNSKGVPNQLKRGDLKPIARGWLDFIGRSILPTSNRSEVTIKRAVMIHCIMLGKEVEVHHVIACEIYTIANKNSTEAKLAYPSLISLLCKEAGVKMGVDEFIPIEHPITKKSMEGQMQDNSIKRRAQEFLPEFPEIGYWASLEASITKLQETMEQLKEEQQNQNCMLCKLLKEQEKQGRELQELKRQKLSSQVEGASTSQNQGC